MNRIHQTVARTSRPYMLSDCASGIFARKNLIPYVIFLAAFVFFMAGYEHYPKPGWADAAIYNSYAMVKGAYNHINGYGAALNTNGATYQFSRVGYIAPVRLLSKVLGPENGRVTFNVALYLLYSISVLTIGNALVKNAISLALVDGFLLFNPQAISAIVSGGADGPACVYCLLSIACLLRATLKKSRTYFFLAGSSFAAGLSAHIFYIVPYVFTLMALGLYGRIRGIMPDLRTLAISVLYFSAGAVSAVSLLQSYADYVGIRHFYFSYSFGRARSSLEGAGAKFFPPVEFWLDQASLWAGVILLLLCSLVSERRNARTAGRYFASSSLAVAALCFVLPLLFVLSFDLLIGGGMVASPHYFNAFGPCFVVGAAAYLSSADGADEDRVRRGLFAAYAVVSIAAAIYLPGNRWMFATEQVGAKALLKQQQHLAEEISRSIPSESFNLVYVAGEASDAQPTAYVDYFEGKKRVFDYVDSLAFLFPWVADRTIRVSSGVGELPNSLHIAPGRPIVLLARSKLQLQQTWDNASPPLKTYRIEEEKCSESHPYNWCMWILTNE